MVEPEKKKTKKKPERGRNAKGQYMPDPEKRIKFKKVRPRTPGELIRSIHTDQLKKTTREARTIMCVRQAIQSDSQTVGIALLENSLAVLSVVCQELLNHAVKSGQIIDARGNLHPSLTQRNYVSYQSAMRQTVMALQKLKGSAPNPEDLRRKSPADLILQISNDFDSEIDGDQEE